jgi:hypothetical protein
MATGGRRKIHLDVDGVPLCGAAAVLQSTSGDPDAVGSVCRKCQRAMERLLRPVLVPQHSPPEDRPMTTPDPVSVQCAYGEHGTCHGRCGCPCHLPPAQRYAARPEWNPADPRYATPPAPVAVDVPQGR